MAKKPMCVMCEQEGVTQLAQELDHLTPLSRGGERLSEANVQPLCRVHHWAKTGRENGGRV